MSAFGFQNGIQYKIIKMHPDFWASSRQIFQPSRQHENFWVFNAPRIEFGLILLTSNMIIHTWHRGFTGPTHLLSAKCPRTGKFCGVWPSLYYKMRLILEIWRYVLLLIFEDYNVNSNKEELLFQMITAWTRQLIAILYSHILLTIIRYTSIITLLSSVVGRLNILALGVNTMSADALVCQSISRHGID